MAEKECIEREAALNSVCYDCSQNENNQFCGIACADYERIKAIHAADVRPVVKAHWTDHRTIEHDGEWYCTACGKEITIYMGADRPDRYRFCPNCGADMREES